MISLDLARWLRAAGLVWQPSAGDRFVVESAGMEEDVFVISDMTVEVHEFVDARFVGFNGTTEWALDSVGLDETLWMPHEHQLRGLLGLSFRSLSARGAADFIVVAVVDGEHREFEADAAANAYARALLALLDSLASDDSFRSETD